MGDHRDADDMAGGEELSALSSPSLWCLFHALELGIELLEPPGT